LPRPSRGTWPAGEAQRCHRTVAARRIDYHPRQPRKRIADRTGRTHPACARRRGLPPAAPRHGSMPRSARPSAGRPGRFRTRVLLEKPIGHDLASAPPSTTP
jgi:hypothetical protein